MINRYFISFCEDLVWICLEYFLDFIALLYTFYRCLKLDYSSLHIWAVLFLQGTISLNINVGPYLVHCFMSIVSRAITASVLAVVNRWRVQFYIVMYNHLFTVHSDVISYLFIIQCLAFILHLLFVAFPTALWSRLLIVCFLLRLRASRHIVCIPLFRRVGLRRQRSDLLSLIVIFEAYGIALLSRVVFI